MNNTPFPTWRGPADSLTAVCAFAYTAFLVADFVFYFFGSLRKNNRFIEALIP
jgi:hypothetical protein